MSNSSAKSIEHAIKRLLETDESSAMALRDRFGRAKTLPPGVSAEPTQAPAEDDDAPAITRMGFNLTERFRP